MEIEIKKLDPAAVIPSYQHGSNEDAGMDLCSIEAGTIKPGEYKLFKTGLAIGLPDGYMGKVCPRSGLALDHGVTVLNAEGTIDPAYRGEIGIVLINQGAKPYQIETGDRIAQLIIEEYKKVTWKIVQQLDTTTRGSGGFGHTGK
ncbi:deoxyuridine 5'-triphosphate nucleotidohydrolase Dut [Halobacteroides halobius DSM 5150]|uniref:Deoxyuridine 5'-triphosphate nucleotidohydrolase n=1 Tax=Halobacteroides halobius (strain ATCC 35273 / DSM 5150 / MD-1) TaxID=748449 RepID=L0K8J6_HALHC|nr:dUTP diphosphatase [Halobacteroides halobius]AGB40689.1 deoxyuridine 5'-triphosphate nucleotidohydrolase Dut [Halobacteroides halobius DSM 5150]